MFKNVYSYVNLQGQTLTVGTEGHARLYLCRLFVLTCREGNATLLFRGEVSRDANGGEGVDVSYIRRHLETPRPEASPSPPCRVVLRAGDAQTLTGNDNAADSLHRSLSGLTGHCAPAAQSGALPWKILVRRTGGTILEKVVGVAPLLAAWRVLR